MYEWQQLIQTVVNEMDDAIMRLELPTHRELRRPPARRLQRPHTRAAGADGCAGGGVYGV